jgi:hypothetical protein
MTENQKQKGASLLWDCFTNWSLTLETLEKTAEPKDSAKKENNKA